MQRSTLNRFRSLSETIISDELNYGVLKDSIESLHELLASIGGVEAYAPLSASQNTDLPGGVAISPQMAAFCATDIARTRTFLRGIKSGIEHLLAVFPYETVQIVYAGTGPYALLVLPLLHHFNPNRVQFTLLDIHAESLDSVKRIADTLQLESYIGSLQLTDACTWQWSRKERLHGCISETMQATLKREPQVAITLNMAKYICDGGIMLPQLIEVEAMLVNQAYKLRDSGWNLVNEPICFSLGKIATLSLKTAREANNHYSVVLHGLKNELPQHISLSKLDMELYTHIQVWDEHVLKESESGLTLPYLIAEGNQLTGAHTVELFYEKWPDARVNFRLY